MLKRKVTAFMDQWIRTKEKKCLVVQGARQTGKTYIIERFAEDNYEELVEINFKQLPSAMDIFSGDLTVDNMVMAMRFRFPEKKITPGKTLIFLDEIQECQEAITSLKFWAIDNRYDVIVSGSLLGIDYKRASSYPVGYVDYLKMYGVDFEEFLWGMGISEDMIESICGFLYSKTAVPEAIHSRMMNYYRQYIAIGGMPEVVQKYIDTNDFREVDKIQRSLLQGYLYDIAHYATAEEKAKAEKCYLSLAKQLLDKENHKFQYKEVEHGGRAQKYLPVPDHPQLLQLFLLFLRQRLIQSLILHFRSQITDPSPKPEPILRHISSLNIQIPMLLIISLQFSQRLIPALVLTVPDHPDLIQLPDLLLTQISGHRTCTDPSWYRPRYEAGKSDPG